MGRAALVGTPLAFPSVRGADGGHGLTDAGVDDAPETPPTLPPLPGRGGLTDAGADAATDDAKETPPKLPPLPGRSLPPAVPGRPGPMPSAAPAAASCCRRHSANG